MAPTSHITSVRRQIGPLFPALLPFATIAVILGAGPLAIRAQDAKPAGNPAPAEKPKNKPTPTASVPTVIPDEKESRTPAQMKLDSHIVLAIKKSRSEPPFDKATTLDPDLRIQPDGRVLVDMDATVSNELLEHIAKTGGQVINNFPAFRAIRALVPLAQLEGLGARADIKFISPAATATTNQAIDSGRVTPSTDGTTKPKP